jgi:hypothetical protein
VTVVAPGFGDRLLGLGERALGAVALVRCDRRLPHGDARADGERQRDECRRG